jgi:RNA polymerase sigma factor (TIGR02999 family)
MPFSFVGRTSWSAADVRVGRLDCVANKASRTGTSGACQQAPNLRPDETPRAFSSRKTMTESGPTTNYPRLRRIARSRLRCGRDTLLDTTALVHESYIRFAQSGSDAPDWRSFLRYAPRIMHNVAVDSVRRRCAQVHGGGAVHVELENGMHVAGGAGNEEIIALRRGMEQLALVDWRLAQVVEMRFFEGIAEPEIAKALGVTERTVRRDWEKARLLLAQALRSR